MSPTPLIECVPNFSEGTRGNVIDSIVDEMSSVPGAVVLDVSSGRAANRTVVTVAGEPSAVMRAAFRGVAAARSQIDMRRHTGVHPRLGATDVVPLVPLRGSSLSACARYADALARRVSAELEIPTYLYGAAARASRPSALPVLRRGQYEGLRQRLESGGPLPDYGPRMWTPTVAQTGATIIGARGVLVALNATLRDASVETARRLARAIRTRGPVQRTLTGQVERSPDGRPVRQQGPFSGVRAIGWRIEEYGETQVSMNLTSPFETSLYQLVTHLRALALDHATDILGCEVVGLIPRHLLTEVETHANRSAVEWLGLNLHRSVTSSTVILEDRLAAAGLIPMGCSLSTPE